MKHGLEIGSVIHVNHQGVSIPAKIRRVGLGSHATAGIHLWHMLTLDLLIPGGEVAYAVARGDELVEGLAGAVR